MKSGGLQYGLRQCMFPDSLKERGCIPTAAKLEVMLSVPMLRSDKVKAEHEIIKKGYVCAANNHRQKKAACSEPRPECNILNAIFFLLLRVLTFVL